MDDIVDWHYIDLQNMSINERIDLLKRTDCPVWFLNQNAGVITHLSFLIQTGVVDHE